MNPAAASLLMLWPSEMHSMIESLDIRQPTFGKILLTLPLVVVCAWLCSGCGRKDEAQRVIEQPSAASQESQNDLVVSALERWSGDLDGMIKRRKIRALVVYSKS